LKRVFLFVFLSMLVVCRGLGNAVRTVVASVTFCLLPIRFLIYYVCLGCGGF
jgi:hypothetical protein